MGGCVSSPDVTEHDKQLHREAEKELREAKAKLASQAKILLLGSGDSGKSTVQRQMRIIHNVPFTPEEKEQFRHIVFDNLTRGLLTILEALPDLELALPLEAGYSAAGVYPEDLDDVDGQGRGGYVRGWAPGECGGAGSEVAKVYRQRQLEADVRDGFQEDGVVSDEEGVRADRLAIDAALMEQAPDLHDGQPFPLKYLGAILRLWEEPVVREAWSRANEVAFPENLPYLIASLPRLFSADYVPSDQDIVRTRARTIGITETVFKLRGQELLIVDVGGQKSERRKWIHCFQDVTSIVFLASLSGYDQCLVEDRERSSSSSAPITNQMQDAMTIWDSICHSNWFKQTSIVLFLNKDDLFQKKIRTSPIKKHFPDFDGEAGNAVVGRDYFKKRFGRIAQKASASMIVKGRPREVYTHITNATDTALLRVVMAAVEGAFAFAFLPFDRH
ncbi:heterotrimeric G protein alpha subunit 4 [Mycena amicta]|nr:heterotrimeric G protein alpha subunit 4 [Mycena amicta]